MASEPLQVEVEGGTADGVCFVPDGAGPSPEQRWDRVPSSSSRR